MNRFLTIISSFIRNVFSRVQKSFQTIRQSLKQQPKIAMLLMILSLFLVVGFLFVLRGDHYHRVDNITKYTNRLEMLFVSLQQGSFIGIPAWMFQTYSNLQSMMGFDGLTGLFLLLRWIGMDTYPAVLLGMFLTMSGGTVLLFFGLRKTTLPKIVSALLAIAYGFAIAFAGQYMSLEFIGFFLYAPLFIWVMDLYFKQHRYGVMIYIFLFALLHPLTLLIQLILLFLLFIVELIKRQASSKVLAIELGWFVLYLVLGFILSFVFYYPAISQTVLSIYGQGAIRSSFEFLNQTWQVFPFDALAISTFKFFFPQNFIDFFGNRFYYGVEYIVVITTFVLMSLSSLVVYYRAKIGRLLHWIEHQFEDFYSSPKKTIIVVMIFVFTVLFGIQIAIILIRNSFYNNFSDDIIQYYSIISDFVAQIKNGTMSWFNLNNYFGASYFSDVYYVPIDIFTAGTFLFSYIMPTELAYSTFELVKVWAGVVIFAYYLSLQGMKPRTIFWMAMVYFVSGGTVSFMAFPVFLSLVFYLPLGLVVIHWFYHGKKWTVPLYALALVLYDFYLGYSALAFVSFLFIIETLKKKDFSLVKFLMNGVFFLGLLLLGVAMSSVMLVPSIQFIIEDTYRPEGSFQGWNVELFGQTLKLFTPNVYIRFVAKMFTEQKPIGFYGFENHYGLEHVSMYITIVGLAMMNYIYFMKGRIAWVYKIAIPIAFILMTFPIFSYVFSGQFFTTAFGSGHSVLSKEFWAIMDTPYTRWINMLPLVMTMILAHVFDEHGFERYKMKYLSIPVIGFIGVIIYILQYYGKKLAETTNYVSRDVLTVDMILMGVAIVVFVLILFFGWTKRPQWMKKLFWVEFIIAFIYIYSGPFAIPNKIDTFESMRSIDQFLTESIDDEDFFRVYVDLNRFNVERLNYNRMTTFPTNTEIFHSWTDMETNEISWLLYSAREYQTKNKMNTMALYINHVLGYKYVLVSANRSFDLESDYFTLVNQDHQYKLYEITHAEPFQVYESYMSSDLFKTLAASPNKLAIQRILLRHALLKDTPVDFHLEEVTQAPLGSVSTASATSTVNTATLVDEVGSSRRYLRYDNEDMKIGYPVGAVYIKSVWLSPSDYGRVFMEFYDGTQRECEVVENQTHQVKCEFWQEPRSIFFEQTSRFQSPLELQYRMEAAIDGAAYLIYNLPTNAFNSGQGLIYFGLTSGLNFERVFVEDNDKVQSEAFEGYYYLNQTVPKRFYILKTNEMYKEPNLYTMHLRYVYDDLSYYDQYAPSTVASNQRLTIQNGQIHVQYTRVSTTEYDQIVMIPTTYSEEWVVQNGSYQTVSVSGGFLGIVIPHGENEIDITLKFIPKGLTTGFKVSLASSGVYLLGLAGWVMYQKQRQKRQINEGGNE